MFLRTALLGALAQSGSVLYVEEGHFFQAPEEDPAFFVYECECLPSLSVSKGLLLLKNSCSCRELSLPSGIWAVLESGNHSGACALRHQPSPVISCGCSARDTLSLASIEDETAVLSLQRNITTLAGQVRGAPRFQGDDVQQRQPQAGSGRGYGASSFRNRLFLRLQDLKKLTVIFGSPGHKISLQTQTKQKI